MTDLQELKRQRNILLHFKDLFFCQSSKLLHPLPITSQQQQTSFDEASAPSVM
jgi:hypothetical protein